MRIRLVLAVVISFSSTIHMRYESLVIRTVGDPDHMETPEMVPPNEEQKIQKDRQPAEPRNPGEPLGEKDFTLASQLSNNLTKEELQDIMKLLAEGEREAKAM